jgi:hypothetical protein
MPNTSTGFTEPSVSHVDHSSLLATQRSETIRAADQRTVHLLWTVWLQVLHKRLSFHSNKRKTQQEHTIQTYNINTTVLFSLQYEYST